ncbi:hypothetical protein AOLI_G00188850 [Acnodon oligacanthus]
MSCKRQCIVLYLKWSIRYPLHLLQGFYSEDIVSCLPTAINTEEEFSSPHCYYRKKRCCSVKGKNGLSFQSHIKKPPSHQEECIIIQRHNQAWAKFENLHLKWATMFAVWPVNLQPALSSSLRCTGVHLLVSGEQTRGESPMMAWYWV